MVQQELEGTEITIVPRLSTRSYPTALRRRKWKWVVDALKEVYSHAMKCGVEDGDLNLATATRRYFLNRGDQALALAKEVGPECGVCLDLFHMNIEEVDMFAATIRRLARPGSYTTSTLPRNNRPARDG
jgi:sugar phosphate isomerase/epimerase